MAEEVKLIGNWASPFTRRVELALKIKGVKYEYIEEDLANKSDLLLKYNPIHKKVPVLVHNGKSICESLVIIEYIDETWKHHHHILPKEPYHRAVARFWARFVDEKLLPTTFKIECAIKEEKDKIIHEVHEHLKLLEHELKHKEHEFFGGLELGYLDIVTFFIGHWVQVHQEVMEIDLITEEKYPFFCKWMVKLHKIDIVHGCLPPKEKHIAFFKAHFGAVKFTSK
ncbi:glutathione s-transferase, putative [Ricinus communis]|uniref:glutathione transferase n=1 Tax=Ricinus communis TaxID=3988 RepID=B9S3B1_RICCO|nr:glutathione s-transferase, putative [Ricinus communis]